MITVPPGIISFVFDSVANTVTIWNGRSRTFYVQSMLPSLPGSASSRLPAPVLPPIARSPFADLEVFSFTFALANHAVTSGLPTTGLVMNIDFKMKDAPAISHISATMQLADEFAAFPVAINAHVDPGTSAFSGRLSYLVDDFAHSAPASIRFTVPGGYAPAASLIAVLFG